MLNDALDGGIDLSSPIWLDPLPSLPCEHVVAMTVDLLSATAPWLARFA